eukprot:scaffold38955_cov161-Skeletonema_marinoi.AAC.1
MLPGKKGFFLPFAAAEPPPTVVRRAVRAKAMKRDVYRKQVPVSIHCGKTAKSDIVYIQYVHIPISDVQ